MNHIALKTQPADEVLFQSHTNGDCWCYPAVSENIIWHRPLEIIDRVRGLDGKIYITGYVAGTRKDEL